jgi:hypothetical protein
MKKMKLNLLDFEKNQIDKSKLINFFGGIECEADRPGSTTVPTPGGGGVVVPPRPLIPTIPIQIPPQVK